MKLYDELSKEGKTLVDEAIAHLAEEYNPETGLVLETIEEKPYRSIRNSMYYALGKMMRSDADAKDVAARTIRTILSLQMKDPAEIWHGTFQNPDEAFAPKACFDWRNIGISGWYAMDATWEKTLGAYDEVLEAEGRSDRIALLDTLIQSYRTVMPEGWTTHEPNLREFIGMTFAMMLEHFEQDLPEDIVSGMEESAELFIETAIERRKANLIPLNTNIMVMYIFQLDYYGDRLSRPEWMQMAIEEAEGFLSDYREFHACEEFNSPTYCGVDLATIGFWRRYGHSEEIRRLGSELEEGLWRDMADFYNPAMRNFCGPYSRCYELDMSIHTCFYDMLYWKLGEERFPWHPFSTESPLNLLMVLGDVRIPEDVVPRLLEAGPERQLVHRFRELSERSDPSEYSTLCTATAFITPHLMIGAMEGSRNTNCQLHPLLAFWMYEGQIGTIRLYRTILDGRETHLHTVLFNAAVDGRHAELEVSNLTNFEVTLTFGIEYPGVRAEMIQEDLWNLPGLQVKVRQQMPEATVVQINEHRVEIRVKMKRYRPQTTPEMLYGTYDFTLLE